MKHIPPEAFDYYVSLGPERCYQAVADRFGVSKRGVNKHALANNWAERLAKVERDAQEKADKRLSSALVEMRTRHMKTVRAMNARALEGLKQYPLNSGMDAMRAAEMAIKLERLIAGEASERTALSVEEVTRQEMRELLVVDDEPLEDDDDDAVPG